MKKYEIIFKKIDEFEQTKKGLDFKVNYHKSKNIQELSKLSYEIKNPQPVTYSFS